LAGTPVILNGTGGMVDQAGFVDDQGNPIVWSLPFKQNLNQYKHGEWCYVLPNRRTIIGSPMTPYLYDENASIEDIVRGLQYWYDKTNEERESAGLKGREFAIKAGLTSNSFSKAVVKDLQQTMNAFKPRPTVNLFAI
jgi:hypothetical protein